MRLFVAAELPAELVEALSETSALLRSAVRGRYVGTDLFHVTLAFLGQVPQERMPLVASCVGGACEGQAAFCTSLGELGTFGKRSTAVLWQGFCAGQDRWQELAREVRGALEPVGYVPDYTHFVPHVTLMRRADVTGGSLPMPCITQGIIDTVTLYVSDLSGERPRYEALEHFALGNVKRG